MILVRDVFQLKFGKMKDAKALFRELGKSVPQPKGQRILTDLTGQYYTLVMESTHKDLAAYQNGMQQEMSAPGVAEKYAAWYQKFIPLVDSGRREIFTIEE